MTQHQAPEVTSEMAAIIERLCRKRQVYNGRNTFRYEFVNPDGPEIAKLLTRATQPLSLTVDEARIAEREACAMVAERIGECANTSGRSGCCETTGDDIAAAIRARSDRADDISYAGVGP